MYTQSRTHRRAAVVLALALALLLVVAGGAIGATLVSQDEYRLPAGEVIEDNLYVTGGTILIDGKIDGDLVAVGGYIEVNGEITGDILAAGGAIIVNGPVAGDVRIAGGGLTLNGPIGGDLVSAGGGAGFPGMPSVPMTIGGRQVQQGTELTATGSVGKDALMAGGSGIISGRIAGTLWAGMGSLVLSGEVGGNAHLYTNQLVVSDSAKIGGVLYYTTDASGAAAIPAGVAVSVERVVTETPQAPREPSLAEQILRWTIGLVRALIGLLVLGWLLLRLLPRVTARTLGAMETQPLPAIGVGLLVVLVAVPVLFILVGLAWLFWGFFPGALATAMFLLGVLGVIWFISPAFTGLWLGRRLFAGQASDLLKLVLGVLVVVLAIRVVEWIPFAGGFIAWLLLLLSFSFAAGGMILGMRGGEPAATPGPPTGPPL